jgi:hypothetical protein
MSHTHHTITLVQPHTHTSLHPAGRPHLVSHPDALVCCERLTLGAHTHKQQARQVALTKAGQHHSNQLASILRPGRNLCTPCRRAGVCKWLWVRIEHVGYNWKLKKGCSTESCWVR